MAGPYKRGGALNPCVEVFESFRNLGTDADQLFYGRALGQGVLDMLQDDSFAGSYDHLDVSSVATVDDIFFSQQMSGRNDGCSQFVKGDCAIPELVAAFQDQHNHVATADAQTLEIGSRHVCVTFHVGK